MNINKETFKIDFKKRLLHLYAVEIEDASNLQKYMALGELVKEYISQNLVETNKHYAKNKTKQVYYFSMEFLIGRLLSNNLLNLGLKEVCIDALKDLNIDFNELENIEADAGLGNGGLGRLAACFLDSMASLELPGHGCGIRYDYGLFEQKIVDGYQVESPDNWLRYNNVWETRKEDKAVTIKFGGHVNMYTKEDRLFFSHENCENILAVPYDSPVIGYNNNTVNTLRLWKAEPVDNKMNFDDFSKGQYSKAVEYKESVQAISSFLYPDDSKREGKLLRLKQQYFFVSAGLQSIIRRYKKSGLPINDLHKHIAVHINDTHPAVAVAELMRILIDEENILWDEAWNITTNTMAYTNHTIMSEALEKWSVDLFKELLPRIYMIIVEIDKKFCEEVNKKYNDYNLVETMRIIKDNQIKMAHLAIVGSHSVNGVAKIHTEILKGRELANFYNFYPEKFNNKTNGITHRRWLINANPKLTGVINNTIGTDWITDPIKLNKLLDYKNDSSFKAEIMRVKQENKNDFANFIKEKQGIILDPHSIYDTQVKRLHLYKRQLLNVLHIMDLYRRLKENPNLEIMPRTFFFGAKAAPSYWLAKKTIKLINTIANIVNNDKTINDKIKIVFLENYSVSLAEKIIPCSEVSEQISTTTKEASGTGNMKFMMNGAITIATLDGANVEIKDFVGEENIVIFGMEKDEVMNYERNKNYRSVDFYNNDFRLKCAIDSLINGSLGVPHNEFEDLYKYFTSSNDEFFMLKDFNAYVDAQSRTDCLYKNKDKWNEMSIVNIAKSGEFSSDYTIGQYAKEIWNIEKSKIIIQ